jgi:hypothetical protein
MLIASPSPRARPRVKDITPPKSVPTPVAAAQ